MAVQSCVACSCLAGYKNGYEPNDVASETVHVFLGSYAVELFQRDALEEVLKLLTTNTESPYVIWNNETRAELLELIHAYQSSNEPYRVDSDGPFVYSVVKNELMVGSVYIRVYNETPTFKITDPVSLCTQIFDFIEELEKRLDNAEVINRPTYSRDLKIIVSDINSVLQALLNLYSSNAGLETVTVGYFRSLFRLLTIGSDADCWKLAIQLLLVVTQNENCVADIAQSTEWFPCLLTLAISTSESISAVFQLCMNLVSNARMTSDFLERGLFVVIMHVICISNHADRRLLAVRLLLKLQLSKLHGPRWTKLLQTMLPTIFVDTMQESGEAFLKLFDDTSENPELIWNPQIRTEVVNALQIEYNSYCLNYLKPGYVWKLSDDFQAKVSVVHSSEVAIGGVYLRLYLRNPKWSLHSPKTFLVQLLAAAENELRQEAPDRQMASLIRKCVATLLANYPYLADQAYSLNYVPVFCGLWNSDDMVVVRTVVALLCEFSSSQVCAKYICNHASTVKGLRRTMDGFPNLLHDTCRLVRVLSAQNSNNFVENALRHRFVEFLLQFLKSDIPEVQNSMAVKAEVVTALKLMSNNSVHGQSVSNVLNKSSIWTEFQDQKHDLFLSGPSQIASLPG
ncbi:unnamed protein product [Soboliphyme baturini]|uniref:Uncharacterized protein n=1 Tax=Soboliphyme baturini TaxID=241478 RepID=A0A3P8F807_9BILA|nr:unnamed protein product [Soboliphyme baturini]